MIHERRIAVGGVRTRYLEVEGPDPENPVLFFHGNPSSADDWVPFLERLEGGRRALAPDLVGWGKSERPPDFPYTIDGLAWFVERFAQAADLERFDIVAHDWGTVALLLAARWPESVGRIVVINGVPFTKDYRWHWVGRLWRTPIVGELLLATTTRWSTLQILRQATPRPGSLPELADRISTYMDRGTKRAILALYRDADPENLERAGRELANIRAPALVIWGDRDPYLAPRFGDFFARALGGETQVEHLPDAGHWPWLDRPDTVGMAADFLLGRGSKPPPGPN